MTTDHQSTCTSSAETNSATSCSPCEECIANKEIPIEKWTEDANSSFSKDTNDADDCQSESHQEIVATVPDESATSFGNIVVKNSSDVHFGNNTFYQYQGPVIIKQYTHGPEDDDNRKLAIVNNGQDNFAFKPETVIHTNEENSQRHEKHVQNFDNKNNENKPKSRKDTKWLNYLRSNKRNILIIYLTIVFVIVIIILISPLFIKKNNITTPAWRKESNLSGKLKIIHRNEWLAEMPEYSLDPLALPVPNIIIAHTVTQSCSNRGECTDIVRYIQHYHAKDLGWSDIAYNFLVGGDGFVYEGRGWDKEGTHTYNWNNNSVGIAFIGTFTDILPPEHQISAGKMLIEFGVNNSYVAQDYKLYGHLQVTNISGSPGKMFFEVIKTWPHWTNRTYKPQLRELIDMLHPQGRV